MNNTEKAKKELERIEKMKSSWNNEFARKHQIWLEIAMEINSSKGKKQEYWELVMDLYKKTSLTKSKA